ncbi:MAG: tRNA (adenosine(37)-N6)-threonylcarbamoyltransferase complex ATPase subunit type 1 TsaE [Phycisphaerales bacterium]|nr:tRNA (adenosine(37)-N6)-threonylcarbamoyltransferase complex ATPase subunit type 1 TsaE [Phycisphaerales bacterium]
MTSSSQSTNHTPRTIRVRSTSPASTLDLGVALASALNAGDIVLLHGELGAGKTHLTRGLAQGLGLNASSVSSPTFVLMAEHHTPASPTNPSTPLIHIDAYRLLGDDLDELGLAEARPDQAVIVLEWPSRVQSWVDRQDPHRVVRVELQHVVTNPDQRDIIITLPAAIATRPHAAGLLAQANLQSANARANNDEPDDKPRAWTTCPITKKPVAPDCPTWPFANEKARLADLNRWFTGDYRISREATQDDLDELHGSA